MKTRLSPQTYPEQLSQLVKAEIGTWVFNASLAEHTSWQIGGPADLLVEPGTVDQVATVVRFASSHRIPMVVIGQGTNLLFDDAGLRGIVLKMGSKFSRIAINDNRITAEAGVWVPGLARKAMLAGLTGLEHTVGIPGTLGGLVLMNGGSQRKGIGDNVRRVWTVDAEGELAELRRDACAFSYRHSALQDGGAVVAKVELECERQPTQRIRQLMLDDLRERRRKFPRKLPNCGSVFLSTGEMHVSVGPPGKLIEDAGLKGTRIGNAEVSAQHANFIVNRNGATSKDVLSLIGHIRRTVRERIGFELCCEVRYVNSAGKIMPAHQANVYKYGEGDLTF